MYRQQLTRKEAELTRAEETIRREQQQIQEMRQKVSTDCVVTCKKKDIWWDQTSYISDPWRVLFQAY